MKKYILDLKVKQVEQIHQRYVLRVEFYSY